MQIRRIAFLAFPDFQLLDVAGPHQMFAGANEALGREAYELSVVGPARGPLAASSGLQLVADAAYRDLAGARIGRLDTVITAGGGSGLEAALRDGAITRLVARASGRVRRIASVCSGTFFLAAAGLLDGRRATTHWRAIERLKRFRPAIKIEPDAIYVRDDPVWTSAGVTAGIDLALAMIEADHGRDIALAVARRHVVFRIRPGGQSQFSSELVHDGARDDRVARLTQAILAEPGRDWSVEALAHAASMSARSLARAFRRELGTSPADYVERVRLDLARRALIESTVSIESIAHGCGFGSLRRMDRAFARVISASPSEFRSRFKPQEARP
jgi:transcriptional regulator GlxA family with amidase domain